MKKTAKLALSLTALAAVGAVSMTYAYWNQTSTIDNPFNTTKYGTSVIEEFKPTDGEDWQPGSTVDKVVTVENTGDTDLIVRAKLGETWTRTGDESAYKTVDGTSVYTTAQDNATDGLVDADDSVVTKTLNTENWVAGDGGWFYYKTNLPAKTTSESWLQDVTLLADLDVGYYNYTRSLSADGETWYTYTYENEVPSYFVAGEDGAVAELYYGDENVPDGAEFVKYNKAVKDLDSDKAGYSGSDYMLTVTVETVQATQDAVNEMFAGNADTAFTAPEGTTWTMTAEG